MKEAEMLGMNIRKYRQLKGLTQTELATTIGLSKDYLSKVERGMIENIGFSRLVTISDALDVKLFQLIMRDSESKFIVLAIDEANFEALKTLLEELIRKLGVSNE
ncbi:hypothetical protein ES703_104272 [subsurface metagenome]